MGGETRVTPWLEDLADLAHDVENLLDEFATEEVLRSSFMYFDEAGASSSKLRNLLIPSCRFFFEPQKAHIRPKRSARGREMEGGFLELGNKEDCPALLWRSPAFLGGTMIEMLS
ncbi:hypothetical protein CRG98_016915 [Punica granatum]|uniref:Rx N-terminal domain-containing protein n=1 Tax=Punica granatum TaxID=22663 RepID=A0A2I0K264_PUNGR|nr:hypothetical protein CRG98_016915 [Punica granatum]